MMLVTKKRVNRIALGTSNSGNLTGKLMGTLTMVAWYKCNKDINGTFGQNNGNAMEHFHFLGKHEVSPGQRVILGV
jgi:hypothetical protein